MAAIDFPSSPIENQLFTAATGLVYRYNSPVWNVVSGAACAEPYNYIINGGIVVSQQNGLTDGTVNTLSLADQWGMYFVTTTGVFRGQRIASSTPGNSPNRIRITINTANGTPGTGDSLYIRQPIEGYRVANFRYAFTPAMQMVLRFGWRSPAGTYSIGLRNNAGDRSYVTSFTISSGDANLNTLQTVVIPGDTAGTWLIDTGIGFDLTFGIAVGTARSTTANTWQAGNFYGVTGATNGTATSTSVFELFDVGLYRDPYNTGIAPPFKVLELGEEYTQCKRYYNKLNNVVVETSTLSQSTILGVQMRSTAPTVAGGGTGFATGQNDGYCLHFYQTTRAYQTITINARM